RRPPRPTPFPYTTLFRSAALEAYGTRLDSAMAGIEGLEDLFSGVSEPTAEMAMRIDAAEANHVGLTPAAVTQALSGALLGVDARSEEHTSELQSRGHLVC